MLQTGQHTWWWKRYASWSTWLSWRRAYEDCNMERSQLFPGIYMMRKALTLAWHSALIQITPSKTSRRHLGVGVEALQSHLALLEGEEEPRLGLLARLYQSCTRKLWIP